MKKSLLKTIAVAGVLLVAQDMNAQVQLTMTLPPFGTKYDYRYATLVANTPPPAEGANITWDYSTINSTHSLDIQVKSLSELPAEEQTACSSLNIAYVEEKLMYPDVSWNTRDAFSVDGDYIVKTARKSQFGAGSPAMAPMANIDTIFQFNIPYQSTVLYEYHSIKYAGYGNIIIDSDTYNDVVMIIFDSPYDSYKSYKFYTITPYYHLLAAVKVYDNGNSMIEYFKPIADTNPLAPAAPTNLAAAPGKTESATVHLTWTDNANNETGFKVERSTDGTSFTQIADLTSANVQSYDDASADAGTTYHYRVLAYNTIGSSAFSNVAQTTTGTTGIEAIDIFSSLAIYPNPSNTNVTISNVPKSSTVNVIDITGKAVYRSLINNEQTTINTTDFENGVYIIQIANSGVVTHRKLMVSK